MEYKAGVQPARSAQEGEFGVDAIGLSFFSVNVLGCAVLYLNYMFIFLRSAFIVWHAFVCLMLFLSSQ